MLRLTELKLPLEHPDEALPALIAKTLGVTLADLQSVTVFKRSIDARKADLLRVYIVDLELVAPTLGTGVSSLPPEGAVSPWGGPAAKLAPTLGTDVSSLPPVTEAALLAKFAGHPHIFATPDMAYRPVARAPADFGLRPVVVGFGPCGIFAALVLAQMGFKPIVLERGKTVRERTQDTWGLWRRRELNPESNVQFGEGGAGTFSDGKLYSQIKDPRHLGRKVIHEFVRAGAPPEILVEAHPHIGTFKLVKVVENLRQQIIALGGEIRFQQRLTDVLVEDGPHGRQLRGLTVLNQSSGQSYELRAEQVVLALGHSSRDTFSMLYGRGVAMQAKPFSIGFRIEHPQSVIDRARWGRHAGNPKLGAADYKLVHHASNGRSVYSFCMCPGGTVVAATSEVGRVVTNGMSQYSRNERNANAGIVVGIGPDDFPVDAASFHAALGEQVPARITPGLTHHPLAGIVLQRQLESNAYVLGGSNYDAPGQLVGDFHTGRASTQLGGVEPSYKPGVLLCDLRAALPAYATDALREALPAFGRKIKGFDMPDAVLTGIESRTSSPLKMPRSESFQSSNTLGLYPAGEGAGYAGGILSAGVDGIRIAEALALNLLA